MNKSILVIDDNITVCLMLKSWLVKRGFNVEIATSVDQAKQLVKEHPFDLILSDIRMPGSDGFALLSWVQKYDSDILVIMMTGFADIETAVASMKSGAVDYISKPIDPELLFKKIDEAFITQENMKKNMPLSNEFVKPPGGDYKRLFKILDRVAEENIHGLIIGNRGTGKASAVKYIYEKGKHPLKPLEVYEVDSLDAPVTLGLNKQDDKEGMIDAFRLAKGGLLHIKGVDRLDLNGQNVLIDILTKQPKGPGFTQVIMTTEKEKSELQRLLLPKLYSLVEEDAIILPVLKGKRQEIAFFALHFLKFANQTLDKKVKTIDPSIQEAFMQHDWPGNIQELKNCIFKAVLLSDGSRVKANLLPSLLGKTGQTDSSSSVSMKTVQALRKESYEKEKIQQALELTKGNKTMAASILNIDRKTLYNKIKLYKVTSF
ncbi:MAG: sigma-54-dependent transcriptional regulator [Fermentimonas sp.]|jgi:DNA-binding NtrC family response regulator